LFAFSLIAVGTNAFATEGGGGAYPNGAENFMSGALPPAGTYFLDYLTYYSANKYVDKDGNSVVPDFKVHAVANGFRFLHMTNQQVLGGNWGMHVFICLAKADVSMAGKSQHKEGLADIVIDPFVFAWHTKNFHYAVALETFVPTGKYDKNDMANLGRNYWTFEPIFAGTYLSDGGFETSMKFHYDLNTKNHDTDYLSGQEFHIDYTVAQKIKDFSLGLGGYYYQQVTDDKQNGAKVGSDGNKGRVFAIGPQLKYDYKNMMFMLTYATETSAKNRPDGNKLWFKFFVPL
jgi:hypothetical protein